MIDTVPEKKSEKRARQGYTPEQLFYFIATLAEALHLKVYVVGGWVREQLLKRPRHAAPDIDCVVIGDAMQFARQLAEQSGFGRVTVFERFRTARLMAGNVTIEFVTARRESYHLHSRKPEVMLGTLEDDLRRRDFTINTLAREIHADSLGLVIDIFGGREDLAAKIIRTPLDPAETFHDDPLRMLRAIRFSAQLRFDIQSQTLHAIEAMRTRISIVSQERITDELVKIIACRKPSHGFHLLKQTGLLATVFPEIHNLSGVDQRGRYHHKDVFLHTLKVLDNVARRSAKLQLRLAALLHDVAKPATKNFDPEVGWTFHGHEELGAHWVKKIIRRLVLPMEYVKYIERIVRLHLRPINLSQEGVTDSAIRRLIVKAGDDLDDLLLHCRADITSSNPRRVQEHLAGFDKVVQRIGEVKDKDALRAFQSPVRGDTIMEVCGIPPGPIVGQLKEMIEEAILDGEIPNEYDAAYDFLCRNKDSVLAPEHKNKNHPAATSD